MKPLNNKIALITGASRGIGKETALHLAKMGADIIVHYANNKKAALKTVQEIESIGRKAFHIKADLSVKENISKLFSDTDQILAGRKLDILINNAGVLHKYTIEKITEEHYDELFNINVKAAFFIIKQALSRLNAGARIINITSYLSKRPKYDYGAYSMTKAALDNLTKSMASELGKRRITVNSVAPGSTDTDMNKERFKDPIIKKAVGDFAALKRVGNPSDIAKVIGFLASDEGAWITGQYIEASGGLGLG